jgi:hypothetical protein
VTCLSAFRHGGWRQILDHKLRELTLLVVDFNRQRQHVIFQFQQKYSAQPWLAWFQDLYLNPGDGTINRYGTVIPLRLPPSRVTRECGRIFDTNDCMACKGEAELGKQRRLLREWCVAYIASRKRCS